MEAVQLYPGFRKLLERQERIRYYSAIFKKEANNIRLTMARLSTD